MRTSSNHAQARTQTIRPYANSSGPMRTTAPSGPGPACSEGPGVLDHHREGPLLLTVEQAAQRLGIGRSLFYELLATGDIESVHVRRLRRIPIDTLTTYINNLRAQGHHSTQ